MDYLLGIDLGTSGLKTVLFDTSAKKIASASFEYDIISLQNGWAEQDPAIWWEATLYCLKKIMQESNVNAKDIKGIGISGQMHGLVMLDKNGAVIRNAILWCDGRTKKQCDEITEKVGKERLIEINANPALTGFTAGKILWVREHEAENYKKCASILLPKDYIRYKLTGKLGTEASDASGTNLFDLEKRDFSDEILSTLEIDRALLPQVNESVDIAGNVLPSVAEQTGLSADTIVCFGAADNAAAGIGTGVVYEGAAVSTIGTSGVIFVNSKKLRIDKLGRIHTFCSAVPNEYAILSCTLSAGMSLKWYRDNFCNSEVEIANLLGIDSYELINQEISKLDIGSDGLVYLPYLMGERSPILDEKARAVFFGVSAMHHKGHFARAIMEGVSYSQKQCLDIIRNLGIKLDVMYACGGGAKSEVWQAMLADIYEQEITTLVNEEGPALGVAILAGVASGIYKDIPSACQRLIKSNNIIKVNKENSKKYQQNYEIYCKLYQNLKNIYI